MCVTLFPAPKPYGFTLSRALVNTGQHRQSVAQRHRRKSNASRSRPLTCEPIQRWVRFPPALATFQRARILQDLYRKCGPKLSLSLALPPYLTPTLVDYLRSPASDICEKLVQAWCSTNQSNSRLSPGGPCMEPPAFQLCTSEPRSHSRKER